MPPKSKPSLWSRFISSRFTSFFRGRGGRLTVDSRQGSPEITNPGGGALGSDHASTRSAPNFSLPVDSSTLQCHESRAPIGQSRSESDIVEQLQSAALSMSNNEGALQQPSRHPIPSLQSHNNPPVYDDHGGPAPSLPGTSGQFGPSRSNRPPTRTGSNLLLPTGSPTPQYHESCPPIYPSRSDNNIGESSHPAVLSIPPNEEPYRHPSFQSLPAPQSAGDPAVPRVHEAARSFLSGASKFQMHDINYYEASHITVNRGGGAGDNSIDGWDLLLKKTAPNALHNSSVRYDAPKCDEDTRVEVTNELMEWIEDRNAPQRLLCMTGAAGSGKSCLQQTAAEKCAKSNILAASCFLSAEDRTRNTVRPVIPTIAYQLGQTNETLKWLIKTTIEKNHLIFSQTLEAQTTALIVEPVKNLRDMGSDLRGLPYAILIDGLDECKGEDLEGRKVKGEDRQAELLMAIRRCLLADDLPFRIFVASRPELAIHSALQPGGHLHGMAYHIQLSDKYDATADMHRYLRRRFEDIGLRINDPNWFSEDDVETLVQAGSGQFIYVATVYKYISKPRSSPAARLKIVLTWTPREGQATRPFEVLDKLYTNILLDAKKAYEAIDSHHGRDFLLLFRTYHMEITGFTLHVKLAFSAKFAVDVLSVLLSLEPQSEETLISDLRCLVAFKPGGFQGHLRLHLYHKSFSDFLEEPSRAKDLFVPESRVYTHLAKCLMQHIIECPLDFDSLPAKWGELPLSKPCRESLAAIGLLPFFLGSPRSALDDDEVAGFTQNGGWQKVDKILPLLYSSSRRLRDDLYFELWITCLQEISGHLKARKPNTAAVILVFAKKWEDDRKRWKRSLAKDSDSGE